MFKFAIPIALICFSFAILASAMSAIEPNLRSSEASSSLTQLISTFHSADAPEYYERNSQLYKHPDMKPVGRENSIEDMLKMMRNIGQNDLESVDEESVQRKSNIQGESARLSRAKGTGE